MQIRYGWGTAEAVQVPGEQVLQDDDNIELEIDVEWDSRQDVEIDVSLIPGEIDIQFASRLDVT